MAIDIEKLLSAKVEDVKQAPPLPPGTWTMKVIGVDPPKDTGADSDDDDAKAPSYIVTSVPVSPGADVAKPLLAACEDWKSIKIKRYFPVTPRALSLLTDFQKHCGVKGVTVKQGLEMLKGKMFTASITHYKTQRGNDAAQIASTAPFKP